MDRGLSPDRPRRGRPRRRRRAQGPLTLVLLLDYLLPYAYNRYAYGVERPRDTDPGTTPSEGPDPGATGGDRWAQPYFHPEARTRGANAFARDPRATGAGPRGNPPRHACSEPDRTEKEDVTWRPR